MRILVVGAGATGGYFGARLAQAGRDVTFLVRPRRAETLRQRGLRLVGLDQEEALTPQLVTADDLAGTPDAHLYDLVLVSVRATALDQALDDLMPAIGPRTAIVPFLNGIAHLDQLNERVGSTAVLGGAVRVVTTLNREGDIVRLAPPAGLIIGTQPGQPASLTEISAELSDAAFDFSVSDDIVATMWHKWVFIATAGAFTCLLRGRVGDIIACPGGAEVGPAILAEAAAVSAAAGYPVPADEIAAIDATVTAPGSGFAPSMYRDLSTGAGVEVEHILGDLIARARALGVATPLLDLATLHLRIYQHCVEQSATG